MVRGSLIWFTYGKTAAWRLTILLTVAPARHLTDSKETVPYYLQTSQTFHSYWRKASGIRLTASGAQENRWRIQKKSKYITHIIVTRKSFYSKKKRDEKQVHHTHDWLCEMQAYHIPNMREGITPFSFQPQVFPFNRQYVWRTCTIRMSVAFLFVCRTGDE